MPYRRMRHVLTALALAAACLAHSMAGLLPDVERQLDKARSYALSGGWNYASAYTDTVVFSQNLRIFVPRDTPDSVRQTLEKATLIWAAALESQTTFVFVQDPAEADIQTEAVTKLMVGGRQVAGHISWRRTVGPGDSGLVVGKTTAQIRLGLTGPGGRKLNERQMLQAALHELGHFLGLNDTNDPGHVMAPVDLRRPVLVPHAEEVQTLMDLRDEGLRLLAWAP